MAQSNGNGGVGALPSELLADGAVIGAKVRVVTQADEAFEGVIFTLDPVASFLILGASLSPLLTDDEDTFGNGKIYLTHCSYLFARCAKQKRALQTVQRRSRRTCSRSKRSRRLRCGCGDTERAACTARLSCFLMRMVVLWLIVRSS